MTRSKYVDGPRFRSIGSLIKWILDGKSLRIAGQTCNAASARNQQLQTLTRWVGVARKAVPR